MSTNGPGKQQTQPPDGDDDTLFTIRLTLILLLATIIGLITGYLTFAANGNLAVAALAGLSASGTALVVAPRLISKK